MVVVGLWGENERGPDKHPPVLQHDILLRQVAYYELVKLLSNSTNHRSAQTIMKTPIFYVQ